MHKGGGEEAVHKGGRRSRKRDEAQCTRHNAQRREEVEHKVGRTNRKRDGEELHKGEAL